MVLLPSLWLRALRLRALRLRARPLAQAGACLLAAVLLAAAWPLPALGQAARSGENDGAGESAAALFQRVARHHASLDSLSASFTQTYRSQGTGASIEERGRIFVKRPGRMRWDYRRPDRKVFLVEADGTTTAYVPADRQAVVSRVPPDAPHLKLLRGETALEDDFAVTSVQLRDPRIPGSKHLKLVPRESMESLQAVYLEVDGESATVRRVLVVDPLGNESDLVIDKLRINAPISDGAFELDLPRGVDVRVAGGEGD